MLMAQGRPRTWSAPSTQTLIDFFSTRQHYLTQLDVAQSFRHEVVSEILKELSITDTSSRRQWLFREWKRNLAPVLLHNISSSPSDSGTSESKDEETNVEVNLSNFSTLVIDLSSEEWIVIRPVL